MSQVGVKSIGAMVILKSEIALSRSQWPQEYLFAFKMFKRSPQDVCLSINECIELMDELNIERVITFAGHNICKILPVMTVDELDKCIREYPDKFIPLFWSDPRKGMDELRAFENSVKEYGFKGLFQTPYMIQLPPNANIYYPFYAKCVELDVPVWTQTGHTGPLYGSNVGRPMYLDEVALYFPELRIIGGHIGWPWHLELIALAFKYPNVYLGLSAWAPKYYPQEVVQFMGTYGQDKVLFMPDQIHVPLRRCFKEFNEIYSKKLPTDVVMKLMRENARKVFKLP